MNEQEMSAIAAAVDSVNQEAMEKVSFSSNERLKILNEQRNVMLNTAMTFLGIALTLYASFKTCSSGIKWCVGAAIMFDVLSICMMMVAQRKLPRQMGEASTKAVWVIAQGKNPEGAILSSVKWYEEICLKYWGSH